MAALIVFGILLPLLCAVGTCWFVWKYLPPAVVKALREFLNHPGRTHS